MYASAVNQYADAPSVETRLAEHLMRFIEEQTEANAQIISLLTRVFGPMPEDGLKAPGRAPGPPPPLVEIIARLGDAMREGHRLTARLQQIA